MPPPSATAQLPALKAERTSLITTYTQLRTPSSPTSPSTDLDEAAIIADASAVLARHVRLLGRYNEIRDIAQGLAGMLAEQRGVRIVEVLKEMGAEVGGVDDG